LEAVCERHKRSELGAAVKAIDAAIADLHQRMDAYCKQL